MSNETKREYPSEAPPQTDEVYGFASDVLKVAQSLGGSGRSRQGTSPWSCDLERSDLERVSRIRRSVGGRSQA